MTLLFFIPRGKLCII